MENSGDPPGPTPGERLQWARLNRTNFGTASQAAKAFGWPVSTYLGHENGDRVPSRETAKRYARAYRVPWEWIYGEGGFPEDQITPPATVPLTGDAAAGVWFETGADLGRPFSVDSPFIYDPRYPRRDQEAIEIKNSYVDRLAQPGDLVHCVKMEPKDGDFVFLMRIKGGKGGLCEFSIRRYSRRGNTIVLGPYSHNTEWSSLEIQAEEDWPPGEMYTIDGVVIAVYRRLQR